MSPRFRMAVPSKGRMREPATALLRQAGLVFEPTAGALSVPVANAELELLFVRTADVLELVSDGNADWGITGRDLLEEIRPPDVAVMLELGFGRCDLTLAAPVSSDIAVPEDCRGLRVATSHPNIVRRFLAERGVEAEVVKLSGSVEVAPRLGVAEAVADLVSTGSTLRVNGLRPIASILKSEAVLIRKEPIPDGRRAAGETLALGLRSVAAAKDKRYLLLNAPQSRLDEIISLIPGLGGPTVVPLAEDGMAAVHSVVDADDLLGLLSKLKAAGGRDMLVLPIGQLVP